MTFQIRVAFIESKFPGFSGLCPTPGPGIRPALSLEHCRHTSWYPIRVFSISFQRHNKVQQGSRSWEASVELEGTRNGQWVGSMY